MRHIPALFISLYAVSITQFEQTSLIPQELTVNEQNPQAKCFWPPSLQKSGYDQQGRPYPLVSMRRP